jgi:hypothetical protein
MWAITEDKPPTPDRCTGIHSRYRLLCHRWQPSYSSWIFLTKRGVNKESSDNPVPSISGPETRDTRIKLDNNPEHSGFLDFTLAQFSQFWRDQETIEEFVLCLAMLAPTSKIGGLLLCFKRISL